MARADLTHGPNPLVLAGLNLRLAERTRAHPARPRRTRARAEAPRALLGAIAATWRAHRRRWRRSTSKPRACSAASERLTARIRALRGYPIVINAWASWCAPCRSEFGLFAAASARYGRRVAFLGADTDDSTGDAQTFLTQHHVSYPSYQTTTSDLRSLASLRDCRPRSSSTAGKVAYVHTGQYDAQGSLDADLTSHANGR